MMKQSLGKNLDKVHHDSDIELESEFFCSQGEYILPTLSGFFFGWSRRKRRNLPCEADNFIC
jgi:hypothetical protein